ncbi:EpsG family protein [Selenomonas sp. GACV-9]|uniref:EpsG family protein n=1 Tax=Selenomonas sp. GACV-9 TaxID=3158782 RepID=UPI0008ECEFA4|nr:EpsG family protein [Selenomonas ruminantium]
MLIYILSYLLFSITGIFDFFNINCNAKKNILILLAFFIAALGAVRWETGTDWYSYYDFYMGNEELDEYMHNSIYGFEAGYAILNYLVKITFDSYNILLGLISLIIVGLKYETLYKFSPYPLIAVWINFANFNGDIFPVRQHIAIAICLFSVRYIVDREKLKFAFCVLMAMQFHFTAIIFFLAYYLYYKDIGTKKCTYLVLLAMLITVTGVFEKILTSVVEYWFDADIRVMVKLAEYTSSDVTDALADETEYGKMAIVVSIARRIVFLPCLYYFKNAISRKFPIYNGLLNLYTFSVVLMIAFTGSMGIMVGRLSIYFFCFESFLLASLALVSYKIKYKLLLWVILFVYCGLKFYWGLSAYPNLFFPFKTI